MDDLEQQVCLGMIHRFNVVISEDDGFHRRGRQEC